MSVTELRPPGATDEEAEAERQRLAEEEERADTAGRSIEDLAADPDEDPEGEDEEQITLFGSQDKLTPSVGRLQPKESFVKFKAKQDRIQGQFQPDETFEVVSRVRCDKVEFTYPRDGDGAIVAVKRTHHLTNLHVERLDERMLDVMVRGGMSAEEAKAVIARGTGKEEAAAA